MSLGRVNICTTVRFLRYSLDGTGRFTKCVVLLWIEREFDFDFAQLTE